MIICKFGGTSVAKIKNIKNIKKILACDKNRRVVVVSAPGKTKAHPKVTDMLIDIFWEKDFSKKKEKLKKIYSIYADICKKIQLKFDFLSEFEKTFENFENFSYDHLLSRGEYLSSKIFAKYLGLCFVDAKDLVKFSGEKINKKLTFKNIKNAYKKHGRFLTGGFYGSDENLNIKILPRGGSDTTGAIIASALCCQVYENWTDVDGIYKNFAIKNKKFSAISAKDALKIIEKGAGFLSADVFDYIDFSTTLLLIKNTQNPISFGTIITKWQKTDIF